MKFKVGDRVRLVTPDGPPVGSEGTVIATSESAGSIFSPEDILVEFDNNFAGHDGYGLVDTPGKYGHCWFLFEGDCELLGSGNVVGAKMNCENCPKSRIVVGCSGIRACEFVPGEVFHDGDGCGVMPAILAGDREGFDRELGALKRRFSTPNIQNITKEGMEKVLFGPGLRLEKKWGFEVGDWVQHTGATSAIGVVCGFGGEMKGSPSEWKDVWVMLNDRENCIHKEYAKLLPYRPKQPTDWPVEDKWGDPRIQNGALVVLHEPYNSCGMFGGWKDCVGGKGAVLGQSYGRGYRLVRVSLTDGRKPRWRVQDCTFVKMMEEE